jgi:hypothetical protein
MPNIRSAIFAGVACLIALSLPQRQAEAQLAFTSGPLSWPEFVRAVETSDQSKINFSCTSLRNVMDASYDTGLKDCAALASMMSGLVEADCPAQPVYTPQARHNLVVNDPVLVTFAGQKCRYDNRSRPLFVSTGVPIIVPASVKRSQSMTGSAVRRTSTPTTQLGISKGEAVEPPAVLTDTKTDTLLRTDTVTVFRRDTITLREPAPPPLIQYFPKERRSCWNHVSFCTVSTALLAGGAAYAGYMCWKEWCREETNILVENTNTTSSNNMIRRERSVGLRFSLPFRP